MYSQSEARALSPHFVHILCYSLLMHYNPSKKRAGQVIYSFTKQLPFLLLGSCPGDFAYHCYLLQLIVFGFIFYCLSSLYYFICDVIYSFFVY